MGRRLTITLDDDAAARLGEAARRAGAPVEEVAPDALRRALPEKSVEKVKGTPYVSDNSSHYAAAKEWLSAVLSGEEPVSLPWTSVDAFLRIMPTSRRWPSSTTPPSTRRTAASAASAACK